MINFLHTATQSIILAIAAIAITISTFILPPKHMNKENKKTIPSTPTFSVISNSTPVFTAVLPAPSSTPTITLPKVPTSSSTLLPNNPYIDAFCDNKGNCVHSQFADKNSSSYQLSFPTIHVGDTLTYTVRLINSQNKPVLADFLPYNNSGEQKWSSNLTFTKTFTKDDINTTQYYVNVYIKAQNEDFYRLNSCKDGPCDDFAGISYVVFP